MAFVNQDYTDFIRNNNYRTPIVKLEVMDFNENVIDEIREDVISGDLTIENKKGSRRSANIVLYNGHGKYTPGYRNTLWLNKKMKVSTGIMIGEEEFWVSRGIFAISEVQTASTFAEKTATVTLVDKMAFLDGSLGGTLVVPYIIPAASTGSSAVQGIMSMVGEVKPYFIYAMATPTPYTIVKDSGQTFLDLLEELSGLYSFDYYYDKSGCFRFQPQLDYTQLGSSWEFSTEEATYLGANHRYKFSSVRNYVQVYGNNILGSQAVGTASDNYAFSPTRTSLIGYRTMTINDDLISTNDLAVLRASYELKKAVILQESVDMNAIPIDILEEDNVFTILDTSAGMNRESYYVQSIQFPLLNGGDMVISCWKVRPII